MTLKILNDNLDKINELALIRSSIQKTSKNAEESLEDLKKLIDYFSQNESKIFADYKWLENNWRNLQDEKKI